ncbi:MAG: PQQ-binding-like beta-propeller repeat protein [Armatimonadetes bacterium]|nr:PQQ-binding-like beta-propeller repeat protein [Armatimonadota bacterium]
MRWLLVVGLLSVSLSAMAGDWSTSQGDHQRTGNSHASIDANQVTKLWTGEQGYYGVRLVGDTVYASFSNSSGFEMRCLDAGTGAIKWKRSTTQDQQQGVPEVFGDYIAYGINKSGVNRLEILRADTGAFVTSIIYGESSAAAPLARASASGGYDITLGINNGTRTYHFDGANLTEKWRTSLSLSAAVTPSELGQSAIYAGTGQYYSIDLATGAANHFFDGGIAGGGGSAAVVDAANNNFFIRATYELNGPRTAITAWHYNSQNSITQLWTKQTSDQPGGPALLDNGDLVFVDSGKLLRISSQTGATIATSAPFAGFWQTPVVSNGLVWVGNDDGARVYDSMSLNLVRTLPSPVNSGPGPDMNVVALSDRYVATFSAYPRDNGTALTLYAVPEPAVPVLLVGSLGLVARRLRSRKR